MIKTPGQRELWAYSAIILIAAFTASTGFFLVDEAIYHLGARAISEHGALSFDNGFDQFHSESLKLLLLVDGPQGLTPQYPAGSAFLAAPLLPFLGPRAFILLNALAAILTLFTVRKICISEFKSEAVARIAVGLLVAGTFWLEYAVGIWPHALSAYFVVQAYWLALRHLNSGESEWRCVALSGLLAGSGILFRIDAAIAIPAIGLILIIFADRPLRSSFWFGVGALPPLFLQVGLNYLKFGSFNPFSYGQLSGNTNLAAHLPLLAGLIIVFGALLIWRKFEWKVERKAAIVSLAVLCGILLAVPATSSWLLRCWNGFISLVVDMRHIQDHRTGVEPGPGQTMLFWNLAKKALGQSMPWIGLAAILVTRPAREGEGRIFGTLLVFTATMTMPFIALEWHGGLGNNMRYFLPVLPALCIVCAKLLHDLWQSVPNAAIACIAGVWAAIALVAGWAMLHPSGFPGVHQIASTYVLLATAFAAMAAGPLWRFGRWSGMAAIFLFGSGFAMSMGFAISDFTGTQHRRSIAASAFPAVTALPPKSLLIAFPEWGAAWLPRNGSILAARDPQTKRIDQALVVNALDAGYRVFIIDYEFDASRDVPPGIEQSSTNYTYPGGRMIELRRPKAN